MTRFPTSAPALPVPAHVERLFPYQPGKPIEDLQRELGIGDAIKLASNENPLGPSPRGLEAARDAAGRMNLYPDGGAHRLREAIADELGVKKLEVVTAAGSNELIELLVRTFCEPGRDEVVSHAHAFVMYKLACMAQKVAFVEAPVGSGLRCDVKALARAVTDRTRLLFVPNPNNPTGTYITRPELDALFAELPPGLMVVMDEAYQEYASVRDDYPIGESYRTADRPWIITLRTFSKIYGLAGLRVGYAVCDERIAGYLHRVRMPFNVNAVAQAAAIAALGDVQHVERSRQVNDDGLAQLGDGFGALGLGVTPSVANFVLVDVKKDALPVYEALLRLGVITRPLAPYGLPTQLRVSVGTSKDNERALGAFRQVLG